MSSAFVSVLFYYLCFTIVIRADLINLFVFRKLFMRIRRIFQLKQLNFNVTTKQFGFNPPDTILFSLFLKFKLEREFTSRILYKVLMKQTLNVIQSMKVLGLSEMSKSYLTINKIVKTSSRLFFVGFRNITTFWWFTIILSISTNDKTNTFKKNRTLSAKSQSHQRKIFITLKCEYSNVMLIYVAREESSKINTSVFSRICIFLLSSSSSYHTHTRWNNSNVIWTFSGS